MKRKIIKKREGGFFARVGERGSREGSSSDVGGDKKHGFMDGFARDFRNGGGF